MKTFIGQRTSTADQTSYTFTALPIGAAAADRLVVVFAAARIVGGVNRSLSSATIGGVAATIHANPSAALPCAVFSALVPSGTTADVSVTWSGAQQACAIQVYTLTGLGSTTPVDVKTASVVSNSGSVVLTTTAGCYALAAAWADVAAGGFTSWTAPLVVDANTQMSGETYSLSAASATATGTSVTAQVSWPNFATLALAAISFAPRPTVAPGDSVHGHIADSPTVATKWPISPDAGLHTHLAGIPDVSTGMSVAAGEHSHIATSPTVLPKWAITAAAAIHSHVADSPSITPRWAITVNHAFHGQSATSPAIVKVVITPIGRRFTVAPSTQAMRRFSVPESSVQMRRFTLGG